MGKEVVDLYDATVNGEHERAVALQKRLIGPNQAVTKQFGVPGLKVAMDQENVKILNSWDHIYEMIFYFQIAVNS